MQVQAVSLPEDFTPKWEIQLFQDPNGHWFAKCQKHSASGLLIYTATYSDPHEALFEALTRNPIR